MKEGYYPSANEVIQGGMKEAIDDKSTKDSIDIQYDKITRRFTVTATNGYSIFVWYKSCCPPGVWNNNECE